MPTVHATRDRHLFEGEEFRKWTHHSSGFVTLRHSRWPLTAQGRTIEEAEANLRAASRLMLQTCEDRLADAQAAVDFIYRINRLT